MSEITIHQAPGGEPVDVAFADPEEVRLRIGRASFTTGETEQVTYLLVTAATIIAAELGQTEAWVAALDPVPSALRTASIEMVARIMLNPAGVRSQSRTLGKASSSQSFADAAAALALTADEEKRIRRAVLPGGGKASARMGSVLDSVAIDLGTTGARYAAGLIADEETA